MPHDRNHIPCFLNSDLGSHRQRASGSALSVVWFHPAAGKLETVPLPHQVENLEEKENQNELVHPSIAAVSSCTVALLRVVLRQFQGLQVVENVESVGLRAR